MLGIFYIFICIVTGYMFCKIFFPRLIENAYIKKSDGTTISLPSYYVLLPAWYLTGTLIVTWLVYIVSYICKNEPKPLIFGNVIVLGMLLACFAFFYGMNIYHRKIRKLDFNLLREFFWNGDPLYAFYSIIVLCFCTIIMYRSFNVTDDTMNVGLSVWGDFGAHLGMIRSFSYSNNFPTGYTYYGGADIRYHFMHEFLVGNLEFLGLRIDHAFNIPSIFNLFSVYMLLFTLTVHLFYSRLTACLGGLLFTFRSSFSAFDFLANDTSGNPLKALLENRKYFTYSEYHEGWGFWCTRVFCNQRHLAFGMTAILLSIIIFLPYLREMGDNMVALKSEGMLVKDGDEYTIRKARWYDFIKVCFFSHDSFAIKNPKIAIGSGLFLGMLAFWHGSCEIAALAMLFFMAAFSVCRLDYLIAAVIAVVLSFAQTKFFINGAAVSPSYYFGFLAENRTVFGVLSYIVALTGITLLVAVFGMLRTKGAERYMFLVSAVPFIMSFFLSLTPDIGVNHKWIIISLMFLSMYTAYFLTWIIKERKVINYLVAGALIFVLTFTGVTELYIQAREDDGHLEFSLSDETTLWLKENVTCDDLVLTDSYPLTNIVLGGIMSYYAYPYCAWSAGYDTAERAATVQKIFEASTPTELDYYVYKSDIDYIIVNITVRQCTDYELNEDNIAATYKEVYSSGEGEWEIRIFDTSKKIYKNGGTNG